MLASHKITFIVASLHLNGVLNCFSIDYDAQHGPSVKNRNSCQQNISHAFLFKQLLDMYLGKGI